MEKKAIYIAGPITGVKNYRAAFKKVEDILTALGYATLSPAHLPEGLTKAQYMRICFAMIDTADAVVFLPGSQKSAGALLEFSDCKYIGKPWTVFPNGCDLFMRQIEKLRRELEEVLQDA